MYDEIGDSVPFNSGSEFNERKFQFILNYCVADRRSGESGSLTYTHKQDDLIQTASHLYDKALEACQ